MNTLQGFQKRFLRGLANPLKPVVQIGKNGLNTDLIDAVNEALDAHELIKVKFIEFKEERKELSAEMAEKCQCHLAGIIGHVAILYRENPEPEKRRIKLPVREN